MILFLLCLIARERESFRPVQCYFRWVGFMRTETRWRFRSLISRDVRSEDYNLMQFFRQNYKLFNRSLMKVRADYKLFTDDFIEWLETVFMRTGSRVVVTFWISNISILIPDFVTQLEIHRFARNYNRGVPIPRYSNLTKLLIHDVFEIQNLICFPNLKSLAVGRF